VGDVLLGGRLQRIFQRLVENDALLGVDGQLVDQRVLRGDLVVERIDEGLEHRGVALQRLAFGQQFLLLRLLLVVFGGELRALAFQLVRSFWLVEAAILFSMSSSSGFNSSMRFWVAVRFPSSPCGARSPAEAGFGGL
jgi:hypothetical protein